MLGNSLFSPVSPQARSITHLSIVVAVVMLAILALVSFLVLYAVIRFRRRPGAPDPRQVFGNSRLEMAWTLGPLLVITILFILTIQTMHSSDRAPAPGEQPNLIITAHQWWWEARYPQAGVVTANEIHIPVDQAWLVELKSADVIHDWWVPDLGRKMDAIPGHPNHFWIQADKPGTYLGTCAEYCGAGHAWMRIRVIAQPESEFRAWEQHELAVPAEPRSGDPAEGSKLFQELTCADCHSITGTPAKADIGPDLTHVASRETLAAGRLANTPENLAKWIANPQEYKPGSHMPNFHLSAEQDHDLVAYLETLK